MNRSYCPSTVRCYDCNQHVADLKTHRSSCPNSRRNRSIIPTPAAVPTPVPVPMPVVRNPSTEVDFYALIDVSGSMAGSRLSNAKECMKAFFDTMHENDRFAIISFDSQAFFKLKPRPVGQVRRQGELPLILDRIFAQGMTALYDAIYLAIEQIRDKTKKTVINVLTDGEDNSSRHSYAEVLALIQQYPSIRLNIVHINDSGSRLPNYEELCRNRGEYVVITETQIVTEVTRVYQTSYHS